LSRPDRRTEPSDDAARRPALGAPTRHLLWGGLAFASSGWAHSMQNFAIGEFSVSQEGQRRVNGDAHSPQNFARSGFSAPHFEQRIANAPNRSQDGPD
jgi:hypothetical protein